MKRQARQAERAADAAGIGWPRAGAVCVDLSAPLDAATPVYPGDPPFALTWHARLAQTGANLGRLDLGLHTGTHVDAPLHVLDGGASVDALGLEALSGPAVAFDVPKGPGQDILAADVPDTAIQPGDIVLFRTGWEERASTPRFFEGQWPGLRVDAVDKLRAAGAKAIGGDFPSVDSPEGISAGFLAHRRALAAGIPVIEALVHLDRVVGRRFYFVGLPLRVLGGDASPIRAMAVLSPD